MVDGSDRQKVDHEPKHRSYRRNQTDCNLYGISLRDWGGLFCRDVVIARDRDPDGPRIRFNDSTSRAVSRDSPTLVLGAKRLSRESPARQCGAATSRATARSLRLERPTRPTLARSPRHMLSAALPALERTREYEPRRFSGPRKPAADVPDRRGARTAAGIPLTAAVTSDSNPFLRSGPSALAGSLHILNGSSEPEPVQTKSIIADHLSRA